MTILEKKQDKFGEIDPDFTGFVSDPTFNELFYFTRTRIFVFRVTEDASGDVPCWCFYDIRM